MRFIASRNKKAFLWLLTGVVALTLFIFKFTELRPICFFKDQNIESSMMLRGEKFIEDEDNRKVYSYNRDMPLIFIGGVPRSGTTLMRAMLDAHPDVRCGQETRVIPRILQLRSHWLKSEKESLRLQEAGITKEVMNSAIAQFCLEIIAKHGEPAPRLCNKDPLTLKMGSYVIELFPNAKFLFMVRDGRATVHSIISRKVTITGFDLTSYHQCMQKWNNAITVMYDQCKDIGKERCMMVYYEQLVLHPEKWMRKILEFLDVPWNDAVLHHEEFINKPNGVPLSKVERSSDQVIKPVNLEALTKWVGQIPEDVVRDMADIAPMLSKLGYDPYSNPPNYGKPDAWVQNNTFKVKANRNFWDLKAKEILELESKNEHDDDDYIDPKGNQDADYGGGGGGVNNNNNNNGNNKNMRRINNLALRRRRRRNFMNANNRNLRNANNNNKIRMQQLQQQQPKDIITIRQLNQNNNNNNNNNYDDSHTEEVVSPNDNSRDASNHNRNVRKQLKQQQQQPQKQQQSRET